MNLRRTLIISISSLALLGLSGMINNNQSDNAHADISLQQEINDARNPKKNPDVNIIKRDTAKQNKELAYEQKHDTYIPTPQVGSYKQYLNLKRYHKSKFNKIYKHLYKKSRSHKSKVNKYSRKANKHNNRISRRKLTYKQRKRTRKDKSLLRKYNRALKRTHRRSTKRYYRKMINKINQNMKRFNKILNKLNL